MVTGQQQQAYGAWVSWRLGDESADGGRGATVGWSLADLQGLQPEGCRRVVSGPWWGWEVARLLGDGLLWTCTGGEGASGARKSKTEQDESGSEVPPPAMSCQRPLLTNFSIVLTVEETRLVIRGQVLKGEFGT